MALADRLRQRGAMVRNRRRMDNFRRVRPGGGPPPWAPAWGRRGFARRDLPKPAVGRGWQGIDQVFEALQDGNFTQEQFDRLGAGAMPGGKRGHFTGLGPNALKLISAMLVKDEPDLLPTEGLEGPELFRAQLQNQMLGMQPVNYDLNPQMLGEGGGFDFFKQLLGGLQGQVLDEPRPPRGALGPRPWPPAWGRRRRGLPVRPGNGGRRPFPGKRPPAWQQAGGIPILY